MFVDRVAELAFLNSRLDDPREKSQLILLYGRRRVGKSTLLRHWASQSELPAIYWTPEREAPPLQRRKLYARLLGLSLHNAPVFSSWEELWDAVAEVTRGRRMLLILDELPYASEADPAMLTALQHAWDRHFKDSQLVLAICGSHIRTMESLQYHPSPLFGRLTGQWQLEQLPYSALRAFLPEWSIAERITAYGVIGGLPAYLEWLDPDLGMLENIRQRILSPGSMFLAEPALILFDEVREPQYYLSILSAIGAGAHELDEIARATLISKAHLSAYLSRLMELKLVERRLPVTLTAEARRRSRKGRYHIKDAYFRFYFRFIAPYQASLPFEQERAMHDIQQGLSAFIGSTIFETLAQHTLLEAGRRGLLPFRPEAVGSHWGQKVQVDAVGLDFRSHELLVAECKWTDEPVDERVLESLTARTGPLLLSELNDERWVPHYAVFSRAGFTEAAQKRARRKGIALMTLEGLDALLGQDILATQLF